MVDEAKKFGAQGGAKRAANMSAQERAASARKAALARWGTDLPTAEYEGVLRLGDLSFPCAVLSDGTRVLTETDFMKSMGIYRSGAVSVRREADQQGARIPLSLAFKNLKPFVDKHLGDVHMHLHPFKNKSGGVASTGLPAEIISKVCEVWIDADRAGVLGPRQKEIAAKADRLIRELAKQAIIEMVDLATGFRRDQARDAQAEILRAFVQKELRPWVRTFPAAFYEELFRLRGLPYPPTSTKMPSYFGYITSNVVYDRLAPGVKDELKRQTPRDAKGRPKHKLFQRLTEDIGHPKLREHLASVVALMKISPDYDSFVKFLDVALPRLEANLELPLPPVVPLIGSGGPPLL
jgi:hypothetical protein